jgi:hypothetical protein
MELGGSRSWSRSSSRSWSRSSSWSRSWSCSYKYCISTPLEEEEKLNTHLTGEDTFLCCTYPLFIVSPASPLEDVWISLTSMNEIIKQNSLIFLVKYFIKK